MPAHELKRILQKVAQGGSLDDEEMESALETMASGAVTSPATAVTRGGAETGTAATTFENGPAPPLLKAATR